jgi:hypothetical protein
MENIDVEILTNLHVSGITDWEEIVAAMPSVSDYMYMLLAGAWTLNRFHSY